MMFSAVFQNRDRRICLLLSKKGTPVTCKKVGKYACLYFGKLVLKETSCEYNVLVEFNIMEEFIMTIDERKTNNNISSSGNVLQNLILENREKLSISGVLDVLSFDDQIVILETELGLLTVKGENLRINKLSLDTAEVIVDGEIYNLGYSEKDLEKKSGGGIFNKIFR